MTRLSKYDRDSNLNIFAGIPCFNTKFHVANTVSIAKKYVDQVIVVDDGSNDGTSRVAQEAGALVIKHKVNMGAGFATRTCFDVAKANNADILITLDGDGQHNPEEIPIILAPILRKEANIVIGSRFIGNSNGMPKYRRLGINIISSILNIGSKPKIFDTQSCFRAYDRDALNLLNITEKGFGFSVELLIQARRRDLTISEVPISCIYNQFSHSLNPVFHGVEVAFAVVRNRVKNGASN